MTPDAAKLVGLLAEPDRLRVVAALVLRPDTVDGLVERLALDRRSVVAGLERLVGSGLVVSDDAGTMAVDHGAFKVAARRAAPPEPAGRRSSDEGERILSRLVDDGRITQIPAREGRKRLLLDWLAQRFEPGRRYDEQHVNDLLRPAHDDHVYLRRLLVDFGFLGRSDGVYWRSGGSTDTTSTTATSTTTTTAAAD